LTKLNCMMLIKSLDKVKSQSLKKRVVEVIEDLEKASSLHQVKSTA
jgi:hypothetical protein